MAYRRCHDCCGVLVQQGNELVNLTVIQNCWTLMPYPIKGWIYAYTLGDVNMAHCSSSTSQWSLPATFQCKVWHCKLLMLLLTFLHNYFLWKSLGGTVSLQCVLMDQTRQESDIMCSPFTSTRLPTEASYCLILLSLTMGNHTQREQNAD